MDFTKLLSIAEKNKKEPSEKSGHKSQFSAPKKEKKDKPRSDVVQKLIDEKNREREMERKRKHEKEEQKRKEEKRKDFVIPKKKVEKKHAIANVLKDLDSSEDDLSENDSEETDEKQSDRRDVQETVRSRGHESSASNKSESSRTHNGNKSHNNHQSSSNKSHSDKHRKEGDKHRKDSDKHRSDSDKHKNDSSALKHESDKKQKHSGESSEHSSSHSSSSRSSHSRHESSHRSHSREKEKPTSDSSRRERSSHDKNHSSSSHNKTHSSSSHKSDKRPSSSSKSHSSSSSSSKHRSSDTSHSSSREHKDSPSSNNNRKSSSSKASSKKSAANLSLEELREEVRQMKSMEAQATLEEEKEKNESAVKNAHMFEPHKNRQGIELDEAEAKKAKILARTQAILQRTKERLAKEKEPEKKSRGKRSNTGDSNKGSSDKQIKSKSIIKDDSDSDDDETRELDMSFNGNMAQIESRDILKDIKKKIDDKLGNYNFPDRPLKERTSRKKSSSDRSMKVKKRHEDIRNSKHDKKKLMSKQDKMKSLMRNDYQTNFGRKPSFRPKKPIIRRSQHQPPPMNFEDLLKIAEQKCQEKVKEPKFVIPKKKVEERPLTQEEIDRRQREKESRLRKQEQEELAKMGKLPDTTDRQRDDDSPSRTKSKSDSGLLKGALTKPMKSKYDIENENILVCGPSSSKPARPAAPVESSNPWDRIYGQIQKNNPKAEKRKHQALDSDEGEEEESDYDMDDDFIDDGDAHEDVSAHIRNIFGYDKRKYKHIDDEDDGNMEASFASVMKEEARSAKIGRMEDLEDIRREEEELRQKKFAKKKSKHR